MTGEEVERSSKGGDEKLWLEARKLVSSYAGDRKAMTSVRSRDHATPQ